MSCGFPLPLLGFEGELDLMRSEGNDDGFFHAVGMLLEKLGGNYRFNYPVARDLRWIMVNRVA